MRALPIRRLAQHHLAWLVCIALLIPVVQSAAMWHTVSHVRADATSGIGHSAQPIDHAHCVLCLAGEALIGSALAGATAPLPLPKALHAVPFALVRQTRFAPIERPYQSRAPPFASH